MDIIERLTTDHRRFLTDLWEIPAAFAGDKEKARELVARFAGRLEFHNRVENDLLFPALEEASGAADRPVVRRSRLEHAIDEHLAVAERLAGLQACLKQGRPTDECRRAWDLFAEGLRIHLDTEEREIFSAAASLLPADRLQELGRAVDRLPR